MSQPINHQYSLEELIRLEKEKVYQLREKTSLQQQQIQKYEEINKLRIMLQSKETLADTNALPKTDGSIYQQLIFVHSNLTAARQQYLSLLRTHRKQLDSNLKRESDKYIEEKIMAQISNVMAEIKELNYCNQSGKNSLLEDYGQEITEQLYMLEKEKKHLQQHSEIKGKIESLKAELGLDDYLSQKETILDLKHDQPSGQG